MGTSSGSNDIVQCTAFSLKRPCAMWSYSLGTQLLLIVNIIHCHR